MTTELFLYSRVQCELCEQMQKDLQGFLTGKALIVHVIDIGDDVELMHRYGARIPVLVSGNRELCELKLDVPVLESFLYKNGH